MLADPRHSCLIFLNLTRGGRVADRPFDLRRAGSLALLPVCGDVFGVSQIAVGDYDQNLLSDQITASIKHLDIDSLSLWRDPRIVDQLAQSGAGVVFLGGAFLEEEVLIAALEGARCGYDIRLLLDLSVDRHEADRSLVLARLAHHGIIATTIRQALLEWTAALRDDVVRQRIIGLLS
ncbi:MULTISPECIES: hypothetical protein [Bradyrhizobium]|uniref:hypothetical protein n=1 Tax=Bradyrhizobium TaxID=374 RepID=UPI0004870B3F|nr:MULTISPECIES: hypothetical protein [Bradyrhizobium]UFW46461.1 hypothetical protein BaraCB756_29705 [Bradyrhizobium arachidis]